MKTPEEFFIALMDCVESTGDVRVKKEVIALIQARDAEIHAQYKPLVEALEIGLKAVYSCSSRASYDGNDKSEDYWDRQEKVIKEALAKLQVTLCSY